MTKKIWIKLGIGTTIVLGALLMVKALPLWATFLAVTSYVLGVGSNWVINKFDKD